MLPAPPPPPDISGLSGTRPGLFFFKRFRSPDDSFSGKGGISSRTVARTSNDGILERARYSLARCWSSASADLETEDLTSFKTYIVCLIILVPVILKNLAVSAIIYQFYLSFRDIMSMSDCFVGDIAHEFFWEEISSPYRIQFHQEKNA